MFGTEDDSIFLSSGLMTSALLERTLPMLDIVPEVMVETVKGSASCCCRGEADTHWSKTTLESVVDDIITSTNICGKRKRSSV